MVLGERHCPFILLYSSCSRGSSLCSRKVIFPCKSRFTCYDCTKDPVRIIASICERIVSAWRRNDILRLSGTTWPSWKWICIFWTTLWKRFWRNTGIISRNGLWRASPFAGTPLPPAQSRQRGDCLQRKFFTARAYTSPDSFDNLSVSMQQ